MAVKRIGVVGSGIMGAGVAEVAAKVGLRGGAAQPHAGRRRRDARRAREVARPPGEEGPLDDADRRRRARPGARGHRPRRARRLRPRARVDRRGPRRRRSSSSASSTASARRRRSSPPTRRRCPSSRWRWSPSGPSGCAASTSSTPRRRCRSSRSCRAITTSRRDARRGARVRRGVRQDAGAR